MWFVCQPALSPSMLRTKYCTVQCCTTEQIHNSVFVSFISMMPSPYLLLSVAKPINVPIGGRLTTMRRACGSYACPECRLPQILFQIMTLYPLPLAHWEQVLQVATFQNGHIWQCLVLIPWWLPTCMSSDLVIVAPCKAWTRPLTDAPSTILSFINHEKGKWGTVKCWIWFWLPEWTMMLDCLFSAVVGNKQRTKKQQCQKEIFEIIAMHKPNLLHLKFV